MMAKRTTSAALTLVSIQENKVLVSTNGTMVAPGSKFKSWKIKWGDGKEVSGNEEPPLDLVHDYPILIPEPGLTKDIYDISFEIKDNKNRTSFAVVDNVIITRNPLNPPIPGPNITSLVPLSGAVASEVAIIGTGFGATQGGSTVTFDGTLSTINNWSNTSIRAIVPNIGSGSTEIIVTVNAVSSAPAIFDIPSTPPPETFDFYVSQVDGNNSYNGLFPTFQGGLNGPKLTMNAGVALLSAGKSLGVRTGTYIESLDIGAIPSGVSWNNKVRIANYNGEVVWMKPNSGTRVMDFAGSQQYIEFDGINLDAEFMTNDVVKINAVAVGNAAHHIRFKNCTALGALNPTIPPNTGAHMFLVTQLAAGLEGGNEFINVTLGRNPGIGDEFSHGFYIQSHDNLVEFCTIDGSIAWSGNGIQVFNGQVVGTNFNNTLRYNIIRNLTNTGRQRGIELGATATGTKVYGNLIYNITGGLAPTAGVRVGAGTNEVLNNTVYNVNMVGIYNNGGVNTLYQNNISWFCGSNFVNDVGSVNPASGNNIGDTETGWSFVDPQFVNAAGGNFNIASTSPCRNTGANTSSSVPTSINGVSRPQEGVMDIGAFEFVP